MRILLVNDYGSPTGGAEIMTLALREGLRQRGHDARMFSSSAGLAGEVGGPDYLCYGTRSRFRTLLQVANPWAYFGLRRVLRSFKPDVVHVRMFLTQLSPLILPLLRSTAAVYHVVWYRPICFTGTKLLPDASPCRQPSGRACYTNGCVPLRDWAALRLQMWLWRRWRGVFRSVVANSHALRESLEAHGLDGVEVIHNGVPANPRVSVLSEQPFAVFAGRLVSEKGVDVLLNAFSMVVRGLPEARLMIAGDGPARPALEALNSTLGLTERVTFSGHVPNADLDSVFRGAWLQVVPSRWAEPFGLVAVEAMMRACAVVGSDSGGLREIVKSGATGWLVPPDDPAALARAISDILSDRGKAEVMGRSGRAVAERRFGLDRQCQEFLDLYRSIADPATMTSAS